MILVADDADRVRPCAGNPAILRLCFGPEALRPHLAMGLPLCCDAVNATVSLKATVGARQQDDLAIVRESNNPQ